MPWSAFRSISWLSVVHFEKPATFLSSVIKQRIGVFHHGILYESLFRLGSVWVGVWLCPVIDWHPVQAVCSLRFFIGKTVQEIDRWTFTWNSGWLMVGKKKKKIPFPLSHIKTFRNLKVSPNESYNFLIISLSLIVSLSFFYSVYYSSTVLSLCLLSVFLSTYIL